jgi:hypothetical protein
MSEAGSRELDIPGQTWQEFLDDTRRSWAGGARPVKSNGLLGPLLRGVPDIPEDGRLLHRPVELTTIGGQVIKLSREDDGTIHLGEFTYTAEEVVALGTGYTDPGIATLALRVVTHESIDPDQPRPFDDWLTNPQS